MESLTKARAVSRPLWTILVALQIVLVAIAVLFATPVADNSVIAGSSVEPTHTLISSRIVRATGALTSYLPSLFPLTLVDSGTLPAQPRPPKRSANFAPYYPVKVDVVPNHPDYTPDLAKVLGWDLISDLSTAQGIALEKNGFVVVPAKHQQFHDLYYKARRASTPIFVTTDALLHSFHVLYAESLRLVETEHLSDDLRALTHAMLLTTAAQHDTADGIVSDSALQNLAFFSVALKLLSPETDSPEIVFESVEAELALIDAHAGVANSPIFGYLEDYSQYVPRGHYTTSEDLQRYFRTMMWYGRMPFHLESKIEGAAERETRSALLMVNGLHSTKHGRGTALDVWNRIFDVTEFFVGTSDDLMVEDYAELAHDVYGRLPSTRALADDALLDTFIKEAKELRKPAILSSPLSPGEDRVDATHGFRFMGQRYVPDSDVFQQLVYSSVEGTYRGESEPFTAFRGKRQFPRALDIPAALGSDRAQRILEDDGDTDYDGYDERMEAAQHQLSSLDESTWVSNLYWGWLNGLMPLLDVPGEGFPYFMRTEAWVDKSINTWLGSWTELRHDTLLYTKPTYGEPLSRSPEPYGYVEPNPWAYARMAALSTQMRSGLSSRGLLRDSTNERLQVLISLLLDLKSLSEKELRGEPLTDAEFRRLRFIDKDLKFISEVEGGFDPETDWPAYGATDDGIAVVADVHTVPGAMQVLEEGVGDVFEVYVILPIMREPPAPEGLEEQIVVFGGVLSYYEFKQPMADRLTDETWRAMDPRPPLPEWTSSFIIEP